MLDKYDAFLFDLDGTLVDSGSIIDQVMIAWCDRHGLDYTEVRRTSPSTRTVETVRAVAPHLDAEHEAENIEAMERETLQNLKAIPGATKLLESIPSNKWAVATSSGYESAVAKLSAAGLPIPKALACADDVKNGKPAPDAFIKAAQSLGHPPENCLAFEDSNIGAQSALNAGCDIVIIGDKCTIEDPRIITRIEDLREIIADLDVRGVSASGAFGQK